MTPKEKAIDLIEKFESFVDYSECDVFTERQNMRKNAISCAIICVDENIFSLENLGGLNDMHTKFAVKHLRWVKEELQAFSLTDQ